MNRARKIRVEHTKQRRYVRCTEVVVVDEIEQTACIASETVDEGTPDHPGISPLRVQGNARQSGVPRTGGDIERKYSSDG